MLLYIFVFLVIIARHGLKSGFVNASGLSIHRVDYHAKWTELNPMLFYIAKQKCPWSRIFYWPFVGVIHQSDIKMCHIPNKSFQVIFKQKVIAPGPWSPNFYWSFVGVAHRSHKNVWHPCKSSHVIFKQKILAVGHRIWVNKSDQWCNGVVQSNSTKPLS